MKFETNSYARLCDRAPNLKLINVHLSVFKCTSICKYKYICISTSLNMHIWFNAILILTFMMFNRSLQISLLHPKVYSSSLRFGVAGNKTLMESCNRWISWSSTTISGKLSELCNKLSPEKTPHTHTHIPMKIQKHT